MASSSSVVVHISCPCPNPECGKLIQSFDPFRSTCVLCGFRFCLRCNKAFHGLSSCKPRVPFYQKWYQSGGGQLAEPTISQDVPLVSEKPVKVVNTKISCQCPNPKCGTPIDILDKSLPTCDKCHYVFCFKCRQSYHGGTECGVNASKKASLAKPTLMRSTPLSSLNDVETQVPCKCPNPKCGKFISSIDPSIPSCDQCEYVFCFKCRREYHGGVECRANSVQKIPVPKPRTLLPVTLASIQDEDKTISCQCPNPKCGKFIASIDTSLPTCDTCWFTFCFICRKGYHGGSRCCILYPQKAPVARPRSKLCAAGSQPMTQPTAPPKYLLPTGDNIPLPESQNLQTEQEDRDMQCSICMDRKKDTAFTSCGHTCCGKCALTLSNCHICRTPVLQRIKIFI